MKRSKFTEKQFAFALRQSESGTRVTEVCRKMGISEQTYYRWREEYGGMRVDEAKRLKELEQENARLKKLVADPYTGSKYYRPNQFCQGYRTFRRSMLRRPN